MNKDKIGGKIIVKSCIGCFAITIFSNVLLGLLVYIFTTTEVLIFDVPKNGRSSVNWTFIAIVIVSIIVGSIVSIIYANYMLKPLRELSKASQKIADGDFKVTLAPIKEVDDDTELNKLIINFNKMAKKLSETEMLSNDFIANVSHEFKTPLTTIQGYVTLLNDDNLTKEERQKYIDIVTDATKKLTNLTSNILKINKIENGSVEIVNKEYSLSEQIREVIILQESAWENKNIDLDISLPDCTIVSDEELLQQVWMNILSNAIKFSDNNTQIKIYLTFDDENVKVTIADQGCGMSEETKSHIFEKFYQGDTSHSKEGNGLGLALVNKVVYLCGGKIDVQSEVGKGTTFNVYLPAVKQGLIA